ncbi:hypothetical protein OG689_10560 [Kitasatospora sp. NBC_00240]|uniref:hypothetical protein n=1 Tax=Kitasatospora sp. NBC_00240 TaxID=2903567 RepID=UPI0022524099|nr:hypothetical protein [Kitasatospora sp. NBC_00240]MCX5209724.1 hypothetical protein [Kitasatospora sp. NBC_00240]
MSSHRLDVPTLYALLDAQRAERGLSWTRLGVLVGTTKNVFARMSQGAAPDAHTLLSLLLWLEWSPELVLLARPAGVRS